MNPILRTNINLDRRQTFRRVPEKFAFIQLDRDDGGAVLNISEGGLSFNTFAPVLQNGPIHFWFSLNLNERIDVWGEVVWTDETKKLGGLRFIRLPERAERQIREWISLPIPRQAPDKMYTPQAVGGSSSRVVAREPDAVARFVSKASRQQATFLPGAEVAGVSTTLFPILREVEAAGELVPMSRYLSAKRRQLILGFLLGTCISATVAVAAYKYSNQRRENKTPETVSSASAPRKTGGEALPPVPVSPSVASGSPPDIFGGNNRKTGISGTKTSKILATETGGHPSPNAWEAPASNPQKRASLPLQPSLSGKASQQKASRTPQQLWASVQSGNSKAAVALADLYIKGEGVPQNCNQARVLLLFASEKRNAEAIKRLQELDKTGCPLN
jgi:PilZ domain